MTTDYLELAERKAEADGAHLASEYSGWESISDREFLGLAIAQQLSRIADALEALSAAEAEATKNPVARFVEEQARRVGQGKGAW